MGPIHLFDIASLQARWLSLRQATIAENVANANTPSYTALDVRPFQDVLDKTQLNLATTNVKDISLGPEELSTSDAKASNPWEVTVSGNSVSVEQEMMRASQVSRSYSLNTNIVKAFNSMLSAALKG